MYTHSYPTPSSRYSIFRDLLLWVKPNMANIWHVSYHSPFLHYWQIIADGWQNSFLVGSQNPSQHCAPGINCQKVPNYRLLSKSYPLLQCKGPRLENSMDHWSLGVDLRSKYFLYSREEKQERFGHSGKERRRRVGGAYIAGDGENTREELSTEFWAQSL